MVVLAAAVAAAIVVVAIASGPKPAIQTGSNSTHAGRPVAGGGHSPESARTDEVIRKGRAIFASRLCSACHTLKDAPGATGTVGPDLDKVLKGKSQEFIRTSIVDPDAYIQRGYPANVMPSTFGTALQPAQIDALVKYLSDVTKGH
jgi:cytochrome c oxidase subunit 2